MRFTKFKQISPSHQLDIPWYVYNIKCPLLTLMEQISEICISIIDIALYMYAVFTTGAPSDVLKVHAV